MVTSELSQLLRVIADPTRRRILELLGERQRTVSEIAALFPMSRPAISKHLRLLREAGLAVERRQGRQRVYARTAGRLELLADWLEALAQPLAASRAVARARGAEERPRLARAPAARAADAATDEARLESQEHEWRSW